MKIKKKEMEIQFEGMGKIKFEKLRDKNKKSKGLPIKKAKFINTIKYNQFEKLLRNDYILSLLPRRNKIRIYETMPINLISIYRYDVFIKYYYVQSYITKINYGLARKIYLEHIEKFNHFTEPDGRKNTQESFIKSFNILIDDVKKHGIKTIIPVTPNGEIIDGAHRLSIALYLNLKIQFAIFDLLDVNYGKDFFINRGFNYDYVKIIDREIIEELIWRKKSIQKFLLFYVL